MRLLKPPTKVDETILLIIPDTLHVSGEILHVSSEMARVVMRKKPKDTALQKRRAIRWRSRTATSATSQRSEAVPMS
jgi:hypothetical protein